MIRRSLALTLAPALLTLALGTPARAEAPVEFLPDALPLVAGIDEPSALLDTALQLPWERWQDEVPALGIALKAPQVAAGRAGLIWAEGQIGVDYRQMLKVAWGDGVAVGIADQQAAVLLGRSPQPERLPGLVRALSQLAAGMPVGKNQPAPDPSGSYRGIDAYEIGEVGMAVVDDILVVANDKQLAKATVDRLLDDISTKSNSVLPAGPAASLRIALRHEHLKSRGDFFYEALQPSDDFGRELLLGGALAALDPAGHTKVVIDVSGQKLRAGLRMSADPARYDLELARLAEVRRDIHGVLSATAGEESPLGDSRLEIPAAVPGTIGQLTVDRDLAALWAEKSLLLTDEIAAQLDVADSQLSTAFGGFDFGEEVLAALQPTLRVLAYPPTDSEAMPPVLPAAAAVLPLRPDQPANVTRRFRIAWQTVIGLINVERGGQGQPQLELETSRDGPLQTMTGRYSQQDAAELSADAVDLYASLAPTIATLPDRMVLATNDRLARTVIRDPRAAPESGGGGIATLRVDGTAVAELLRLNRPVLIGQNMLEKGHGRASAEREVDTLIGATSLLRTVGLRVAAVPEGLAARLEIRWQ
jgi:hypothetical protein